MVRYLFYTIGDLTYQSPLVHHLSPQRSHINYRILLDLILPNNIWRGKKSWKLYYASFETSRHFLLLRPRCPLQFPILGILVLYSSFHVTDQVSHPHKKWAKLEFSTPYSVLSCETNVSGLDGSRHFLKINQLLISKRKKFLFLMPFPDIWPLLFFNWFNSHFILWLFSCVWSRGTNRQVLLSAFNFQINSFFIIYNKSTGWNSGSIVFINNYKYALHVSGALCVRRQEHYKL